MKDRFAIELTTVPSDVPAEIRLRRFLKSALRRWGLRCTAIRRVSATDDVTEGQTTEAAGKAAERSE